MSRAVLLGSLILVLVLAGLALLRGVFVALSMPLLVFLLYGLLMAPERIQLEAQREIDADRVRPQTPVKVHVTVTNRGSSLEQLVLRDAFAPGLSVSNGSNQHFISLRRGGTFNARASAF